MQLESLRATVRTAMDEEEEEEEAVMPPPMRRPDPVHGRNFHSSTDLLRVLLGELESLVQDPLMTPEGYDFSEQIDEMVDVVEFMALSARNARLGAGLKVMEVEVLREVEQVYAKAINNIEDMKLRLRHERPQEVLTQIGDELGKLKAFIVPIDYTIPVETPMEPTTEAKDTPAEAASGTASEPVSEPAPVREALSAEAPPNEAAMPKEPAPVAAQVQVYKPVHNMEAWTDPKDAPMWRKRWWRFQLLSKISLLMKAAQKQANEAKRDGFWTTIEKRIEAMLVEEAKTTTQKVATAKGEAVEEAVAEAAGTVQGKVDAITERMDALEVGWAAVVDPNPDPDPN